MSLQVETTTDIAYHPIFLKILEDIPGGVAVLTDRIPSNTTEIKKGALLARVIATLGTTLTSAGMYRLVKTAKIAIKWDTVNVVTIKVYGNQEFKVGEYFGIAGVHSAGSAQSITAITKGADTLGGVSVDYLLTAGGFSQATCSSSYIIEEMICHDSSYAPLYTAQAILRNTVQVRKADLTTLDNITAGAVVRGTVNQRLMAYFVTPRDKASLIAINHMRFV